MIRYLITDIRIFRITKTEQQRKLILLFVIIPQLIRLHKCYNLAVRTNHIRNIRISNSKQDSFFTQYILTSVKDLFHCTVIIQQIHLSVILAHAEKFSDRIHIRLILFSGTAYIVFQKHGCIRTVGLCNLPAFTACHLWCKIPPGHLIV